MKLNVKRGTKTQVKKVLEMEVSKSEKMRQLFHLGLEIKEIAELVGVRYNFVYNVISNYIMTTEGLDVVREKKASKKDAIIKMYKEGKSNKEIAIDLKTNYNYVFSTIKQYKLETEGKEEEAK